MTIEQEELRRLRVENASLWRDKERLDLCEEHLCRVDVLRTSKNPFFVMFLPRFETTAKSFREAIDKALGKKKE